MIFIESNTRSKNRKRITQAAKTLFNENTIAHTTVIDIIKLAEIERKTFYNYFESKEHIAEYIYYQQAKEFYSEGFTEDTYSNCNNGFEKIRKYLTTLVEKHVEYEENILFMAHYDYYYKKPTNSTIISQIFEEYNLPNPYDFFIEGITDYSINIKDRDPSFEFLMLTQSIDSYGTSLALKRFKQDDEDSNSRLLYRLLNVLLDSFNAEKNK